MKRWGDLFSALTRTMSTVFGRLKTISCTNPELTPSAWCEIQPCRKVWVASREITLTQPTSTFLVYALGILTLGAGVYFWWIRDSEISRMWWSVSLLLWGIGALLAGTSYQAFAYEIKCAGRQTCAWTSWWEVVYLMFQHVSMNAMLVAVAYSCTEGSLQMVLLVFALTSAIVYVVFAVIGGIVPIKSLITFKLMVWLSTPSLVICLVLNSYRYSLYGTSMDLVFLGSWILLIFTSAVYWVYDELDITRKLWAEGEGIWFSQNDVLHVCLIFWVIYLVTAVANRVEDYALPVLS